MFEEGLDEDEDEGANDGINSNGCQDNDDDEIQCIDLQLDEIG